MYENINQEVKNLKQIRNKSHLSLNKMEKYRDRRGRKINQRYSHQNIERKSQFLNDNF